MSLACPPDICKKKICSKKCTKCDTTLSLYKITCCKSYYTTPGPTGPALIFPVTLSTDTFQDTPGTCWIYKKKLWSVGAGIYGDSLTPVLVGVYSPPEDYTKVWCSESNIMALGTNGMVYMGGRNTNGELGNGTTGVFQGFLTPVRNSSDTGYLVGISDIAGPMSGDGPGTFYAIHSSGHLSVFGYTENGGRGDSTTQNITLLPFLVPYFDTLTPGTTAKTVAIGPAGIRAHIAVTTTNNSLLVWGNQIDGCLGNMIDSDTVIASPQSPLTDQCYVGAIITGGLGGHNIRLKLSNGITMCAGKNNVGQLASGDQAQNNVFEFGMISGSDVVLTGIIKTQMVGSASFTVVLDSNSQIWYCGSNLRGQAGISTEDPVDVGFLKLQFADPIVNFWANASGEESAELYVLDNCGRLWSCGSNLNGQLGIGYVSTNENVFLQSLVNPNLTIIGVQTYGVTGATSSSGAIMVSFSDGSMVAFGDPTDGQTGTITDSTMLNPVSSPRPVIGFY